MECSLNSCGYGLIDRHKDYEGSIKLSSSDTTSYSSNFKPLFSSA